MEKKKTVPTKKVEPEEIQETATTGDPFIDAVNSAVDHFEKGKEDLESALKLAHETGGSTLRVNGARQMMTDVIKNLKPIIDPECF